MGTRWKPWLCVAVALMCTLAAQAEDKSLSTTQNDDNQAPTTGEGT